ncbi:MAG TPA: hypothetical protein VMT12_01725 [Syntrophales bacterium]|nr:hypothetical protein [Syntrophales bacterium]
MEGIARRITSAATFCLVAPVVLFSAFSEGAWAREFCLSNAHGIRLVADEGLVETPVSEQSRMSGSVCELENLSDGAFRTRSMGSGLEM